MMIFGQATPNDTTEFASYHPALAYNLLGKTGLLVSPVGFGTYRVHGRVSEHGEALRQALLAGINLIDTSTNYTDGGAEMLVGEVVGELIDAGKLKREQIVIVSKAGYIQGENYKISQERKQQGNTFPDLVRHEEGLEHCIHPEFLEDQLSRSLARLNMDALDVYLLHNPEYFLVGAQRAEMTVDEARDIYYARIEKAFRYLEEQVDAGRISSYGISSNTFPKPSDHFKFTSLSKVWDIAQSIRPDHHFCVVQCPMNLFESEAATEPNQPDNHTFLQLARRKNLAVLVNRPLNAIQGNGLLRLAGVPLPDDPIDPAEIPPRIQDLVEAEDELYQPLLAPYKLDPALDYQLRHMIVVGHLLEDQWEGFGSYQQWLEIVAQQLVPRVEYGLHLLATEVFGADSGMPMPASVDEWMARYAELSNQAFAAIGAHYQALSAQRAALLKAHMRAADEGWQDAGTLSQLAIRALRSTQGITSVLVGMRHPAYVGDVLTELARFVSIENRDHTWQRLSIH